MRILKSNFWLIWQIAKCGSAQNVINVCKRYNIRQLLIKVSDGMVPFNRLGLGSDSKLKAWLEEVRTAKDDNGDPLGIAVDGWQYIYALVSPGGQADAIMERREKLDLEIILANMEDRKFDQLNETERARFARVYWERQHEGTQYSHCSHRYPLWHPYIPHQQCLKNERCDVNTPMVYWEGSHNPAYQLQRSFGEYERIGSKKQFIPIGSAYARGAWEPKQADFTEYVVECKKMGWIYGWYSLDYVISNGRWDWLETITGVQPPPAWQPPGEILVTSANGANIRKTAVIDPTLGNRIGVMPYGSELYAEEETPDSEWWKISAYIHKSTAAPK